MRETITARRLVSTNNNVVEYPLVTLDSGRISSIESLPEREHGRIGATHNFPNATLVPSYVDIHIHGCAGYDVMEATPEALRAIASCNRDSAPRMLADTLANDLRHAKINPIEWGNVESASTT